MAFTIVNGAVGVVDCLNRETKKLQHSVSRHDMRNDELFGRLKEHILNLSFEADSALETLLILVKDLKEDLEELSNDLLDRTPHRQDGILEKLRRFRLVGTFSHLTNQQHDIVEKLRLQETSLGRKMRTLKWLKTAVFTNIAGLFATAVICSVVPATLHASLLLVSIVSVVISTASWGPLTSWVKRLERLCSMEQAVEDKVEGTLSELEPIRSLVNRLRKRVESVNSSEEELLLMKLSLQRK